MQPASYGAQEETEADLGNGDEKGVSPPPPGLGMPSLDPASLNPDPLREIEVEAMLPEISAMEMVKCKGCSHMFSKLDGKSTVLYYIYTYIHIYTYV